MIYNGFRRIALAHSLLPAAPAAQDGTETGTTAEHVLEIARHQSTDSTDTVIGPDAASLRA